MAVHKKEYYGDNVAEASTVLLYKCGIHGRPAIALANIANKFNSKITISVRGKKVDAKSMLMICTLQIHCGEEITISASGSDASQAVRALIERIDIMGQG